MSGVWSEFTLDPRIAANAVVRAGDVDREVVRRLLTAAFSEGRLDREELDERDDRALAARTLGDLPPLIDDIVPAAGHTRGAASGQDIEQRAVRSWRSDRKEALWAFLAVSTICWVIWIVTNGGNWQAFPWPVFPMLGTGINVGRVQFMRSELIGRERERLERKEAKALRKQHKSNDKP